MGQNGLAYNQTLKIEKRYKSGEYMHGYPKVYSLCDAFGAYPALTADELKILSIVDYSKRVADFEQHILELENIADLNLVNQALNYAPDICPIGEGMTCSMEIITDTDNVLTDKVTSSFSIYDKQFNLTHVTAFGNTIVCTTNDASGDFAFLGWADSSNPDVIISTEKKYEFQIAKDTVLIAKWSREAAVQLVLKAGVNISSVSGAGNYLPGVLVTAKAELNSGAQFSGWYKNGALVSVSQNYSFNITAYTELEARASMTDEYTLSLNKNSLIIIGQGGSEQIGVTSLKNGNPVAVSLSDDSDWITVNPNTTGFTVTVSKNDTGAARNGIVTVTQNESGKKAYLNVQQQAVAPDEAYEWVLNDSELTAAIAEKWGVETGLKSVFIFSKIKSWSPSDPTAVVPTEPCTYADYASQRKLNYQSYTVTVEWKSTAKSMIIVRNATVNIWFDAKIKN